MDNVDQPTAVFYVIPIAPSIREPVVLNTDIAGTQVTFVELVAYLDVLLPKRLQPLQRRQGHKSQF